MNGTKKTLSKTSIKAITFSLLFLISGIGTSILVTPAAAAPNTSSAPLPMAALSQAEANWAWPNGNAFDQDFNPQTQINNTNAQNLGLSWLFPLPVRPTSLTDYVGAGGLGVGQTVLIVNGTIYAVTQFDQVFALNAANGDVIWSDILPINMKSAAGTNTGPLTLHGHDGNDAFTTSLFNHTPTIWLQGADEKVWAIDAINGHYELNFTDFSGINMVQGNSPTSIYNGVGASNILVDQNRGLLISSHGAELSANNGRCFFRAWNVLVNPPTPLWTTYCTPPQPNSGIPVDPNWTVNQVNSMKSAEIFDPGMTSTNGYTTPAEIAGGVQFNTASTPIAVQLKNLTQTQLNATLYNDFGYLNQTPACIAETGGQTTGSTGAGWGGAWVLGSGPTNGMAYVSTNNRDPYVGPCTPGPNLWAASILALNETNGNLIWGFQTNPHDLWDYDCSWWQGTGNETLNGVNTPVIWKTCKNGYLYEINALTGNLVWSWNPPSTFIPRCSVCYMWNALNQTQMTKYFPTQPKGGAIGSAQPFLQFPAATAGFEDEQAYSPTLNYLFAAAQNVPNYVTYTGINSTLYGAQGLVLAATGETFTPVITPGGCAGCGPSYNNATVFAINAATGAIMWHYFIPLQGYRGGVTTSGNVVYLTLSSGDLIMLDAKTGNLIKDFFIGGPLNVLPSVGATASGTEEIVFPITAGLVTWGTAGVPGDLVALTLQAGTGTTGPSTVTTTVQGGASTVTTTVGGGASTITTTINGVPTTITQSGSSTGVDTTTFYGVAAVAAIFIIATGYLAMRGRKPAS